MGERIVLDLETQREFSEVDGRKPELLGVSVVGIYRYQANRYEAYLEADIPKLAPLLKDAETVIGFNINRFDLPVLSPYLPYPISQVSTLDILDEVVKSLGHRVSLDSIAQATLGHGKSGSGLDALKWFKEGRLDLITQYCLDDVKVTKEVYEYGREHGKLYATSRFGGEKLDISVVFPERKRDTASIEKLLREAFDKRLRVEIEYLSQNAAQTGGIKGSRRIDIYHISEPYFEGYCHLRQDVRQFRIDRILDIKPTWQRYTIPPNFVPTAIAE